MNRSSYTWTILFFCALLPISVAVPYLFYGEGTKILRWAWTQGYLPFWINFIFSLSMSVFCFLLLFRLSNWGRILFTLSACISLLGSALMAMTEQRHLLLVVIFFEACLLIYASEWIRRVLVLPYFCSHRSWWESRPKGVPGVTARVMKQGEEDPRSVRVVNFGREGCFVFFDNSSSTISPNSIEFDYGEGSALRLQVEPVIRTADNLGVGLRFISSQNSDEEQDLQDYLIHLRRSGYVSN